MAQRLGLTMHAAKAAARQPREALLLLDLESGSGFGGNVQQSLSIKKVLESGVTPAAVVINC